MYLDLKNKMIYHICMEKCLFVYNPLSGKGKIKKNENKIVKILNKRYQTKCVQSSYAGHINKIISEEGENFDVIVIAGGDGSINETVGAVAKLSTRKRIGIIPAGTVNDVAHSLHIPTNLKRAVKNIINGEVFSHDIFKVNERYGIYVCCSGLFTESSYSTKQENKKKLGALAYAIHGIKKVFSTKAVNLKLCYDGGVIEGKFALMLLVNSRRVAGITLNKKAKLNDGYIDVILVKSENDIIKLGAINRVLLVFLKGITKKAMKGVEILKLNKFSVVTKDDTVINLDGEKLGAGSFNFEVKKKSVDIIVPSLKKLKKNMISD